MTQFKMSCGTYAFVDVVTPPVRPLPTVPAECTSWAFETVEDLAAAEAAGHFASLGPPPPGVAYPFTRSLASRRIGGRVPQRHADAHTLGWCGHPCERQGRGLDVVCRRRCFRPVLAGCTSPHDGHDCAPCHQALHG